MSHVTIALDLSTSCTGYAIFKTQSKELVSYGIIKPKVPMLHKMKYPEAALMTILDMTAKVKDFLIEHKPDFLVTEEVNRGINRIGQKSLDALHFFVLEEIRKIYPDFKNRVRYIDSNGIRGWRTMLDLRLSEEDKAFNAEARKINKRKSTKKKIKVKDWKNVSQRFVNKQYHMTLDVEVNETDGDVADAIALGHAFLHRVKKL